LIGYKFLLQILLMFAVMQQSSDLIGLFSQKDLIGGAINFNRIISFKSHFIHKL
jgi:hypothetical protein